MKKQQLHKALSSGVHISMLQLCEGEEDLLLNSLKNCGTIGVELGTEFTNYSLLFQFLNCIMFLSTISTNLPLPTSSCSLSFIPN